MLKQQHRLAAIMFTDIVGYTALMGSDEKKAFQLLEKNRKLHLPIIEKHNGTFLKEIGDSILASFHSAYDAVKCAQEIIESTEGEEDLSLKIGIHEGDVVFKKNDVYGDGVNIASRLEQEASANMICISGKVYQEIKNKADIHAQFVEEKSLKNVDHPVKIYQIRSDQAFSQSSLDENQTNKKSIIVLPFVNMSPDPDQEYFSDGLTEEIITDLSHIHDLLVISRNSAMSFKGTKKKTKEIAKEVNVRYVLEGSVRKEGNNLRITAQMIDGKNDMHLWAEKYSGTLDDVFEIQEKVSRSIADALKAKLSFSEINDLNKRKIDDTIAYEQYLLARHEIWKCTKESLNHAIQLLENSLDNIGRNEYLLVALGTAYFQYVNTGIDPDIKYLEKADELIHEALELNPSLAKTYYLKSMLHETRGELKEAFVSIKQALVLDPNDSEALMMMAFMYGLVGKPKEGKPYAKLAIKIDPLNPLIYYGNWWIYLSEGNIDQVVETSRKMYNLDKDNPMSIWTYAISLTYGNQVIKATTLFDSLIAVEADQMASSSKALRHSINQEKQESLLAITEEFIKAAEIDHLIAWLLSGVYSMIGEKDKAIDYLERATRDVFINYPLLAKHDPLLENIRGEPRFKELMKRVKCEWENFEI